MKMATKRNKWGTATAATDEFAVVCRAGQTAIARVTVDLLSVVRARLNAREIGGHSVERPKGTVKRKTSC